MTSISVVMATYNGARFLQEQLSSLEAQSVPPYELVISDDGSTDETLAQIERFRVRARFPVVVRRNEERLGYGANFLTAAALATGDHIAFCDQDDVWRPSKLAASAEVLGRTGAGLFLHTAEVITDRGDRVGDFSQGIRRNDVAPPLTLAPWRVFYGFTMVFDRRLMTLVDPSERGAHTFEYDALLSHDLWIYTLASSLGTVAVDTRQLASYRRHGGNVTPSILGRSLQSLTSSLGLAADPLLRRDLIALERAALFARLAGSTSDPAVSSAATAAARHWNVVAEHEAARLAFYAEDSPPRRASGCRQLVARGGYLPASAGGLGPKLLVKDALAGVLGVRRGSGGQLGLRRD